MRQLHTPGEAATWLKSRVSGTLQCDSRQIMLKDGFIAWPGAATDGRRFVQSALDRGATAVLVEMDGCEAFDFAGDAIAGFRDLKAGAGLIAAAYYEHPGESLDVIAVTGTNGKTSTAWWLAHSLSNIELSTPVPCGFVGTFGIGIPENEKQGETRVSAQMHLRPTGLTTPDPVLLQRSLRDFQDRGLRACAMEASSIGIAEHRLDGLRLKVAVFTNFSQDHLDYHGSMAAYWDAKAALFSWPGLSSAVVNVDDEKGAQLAAHLRDANIDLWTVSIQARARIHAQNIQYAQTGLEFDVVEGSERHRLPTRLIGLYNVSNMLGVVAAMRALGVPLAECVQACSALGPVPGRMECLGGDGQPLVVIDYAHTPDALAQALGALRPLSEARGGQLRCIFGCGGDRDSSKRPLMGAVAANLADWIVVTSDNPRLEQPQAIMSQILLGTQGSPHVTQEEERTRAIAKTLANADDRDVVLIAGKGHEAYQDIGGVKLPFSDLEEARNALLAKPGGGVP
jgi:UDP-N-acetylmuramyl-tripeptide synthetase